MTIRIVLADDHAVVLTGFKMIIEQQDDMEVVGEASNPEEALELVRTLTPDVLVSDVSMGAEKNGLTLAEQVVQSTMDTRVVMLTMHDEQEYVRQALYRGATAYVLKSALDEELIKAIRSANKGEVYLSTSLVSSFVKDSIENDLSEQKSLTPREAELVTMAVKGYSNQKIATTLFISVKTVESQKAKIMAKLGISSKPELFDYALSHKLI